VKKLYQTNQKRNLQKIINQEILQKEFINYNTNNTSLKILKNLENIIKNKTV